MTIDAYPDDEGNFRFAVDKRIFPALLTHLHSKKLNVGSREHFTDEESEIIFSFPVEEMNQALADFDENAAA
jgi:hypothetical protein